MPTLLKNRFYSDQNLHHLATKMAEWFTNFNTTEWIILVKQHDWNNLELRQRGERIADQILPFLPENEKQKAHILKEIGGYKWEGHFFVFPYLIPKLFLNHWDLAMDLLAFFTQISTSEFAARPFIEQNPEKMFDQLHIWANSKNEHIRRLASECCRPNLPWASQLAFLTNNPNQILAVLEQLKNDESEYVRRSVANNLNDISKKNSDKVLNTAEKWFGTSENTNKLLKHALRSLLKSGDKKAHKVLGFNTEIDLSIQNIKLAASVKMGEKFRFSFDLQLNENHSEQLNILYAIEFYRPNKSYSRKVFSVANKTFKANQKLNFQKIYHFSDKTTRKHYRGKHQIHILVNGKQIYGSKFELL